MQQPFSQTVFHSPARNTDLSACSSIRDFLDVLTNWYIRRSRDRFWAGDVDAVDRGHGVFAAQLEHGHMPGAERQGLREADRRLLVALLVLRIDPVEGIGEQVAPARAQDVSAGERSWNKCRACHQIGETARNGVGPNLNGLIGRHSGSVDGYSYSDANKNSGLTWDEPTLTEYLANPRAKVPGTKMTFLGLKKEADVQNVIAYLKTFNDNGTKK